MRQFLHGIPLRAFFSQESLAIGFYFAAEVLSLF